MPLNGTVGPDCPPDRAHCAGMINHVDYSRVQKLGGKHMQRCLDDDARSMSVTDALMIWSPRHSIRLVMIIVSTHKHIHAYMRTCDHPITPLITPDLSS